MTPIQTAIYARVSSAQQAEAHTVASQVAALRERVVADDLPLPEARQLIDEGYSGATLVRPALERLRDLVAAGAVDRLYVHSPDRLARKYAYQVLLVDEFQRAGVEVVFLNRELGRSPEDELLLQGQGMMAEYERAKIIERHRRGKRHAARAGVVNVLSGAPYGYRDVPKHAGGGQARYDIVPGEARVVRQVFAWVGRDRLTIGDVCRRLTQAGEATRTGKTIWDRSAVWGMLRDPASMGAAAFGKTRQGPMQPRLRPRRGRPLHPKRAVSSADVPPEDWIQIPVPALIEPEVFAVVQEQLRENQRYARQSRRGALYLLQGVVQCQRCGYAFYGKRISTKAAKGRPRAYAYYRCLGTDAYRFGGERVCSNTPVRTDLLDLAVWREVCELLAHPERLAEEYQRRRQPHDEARRQEHTTLEVQLGKLEQGLARLIDSYAEGLLEKQEFEPRITRLRQRIGHLEAQRQQLAEDAALQIELQLIIGCLEDFASKVHAGLAETAWASKREMIRTLVKRVEVAHDQVKVVFRVEPRPGDSGSEKKVCNIVGGVPSPIRAKGGLHELDRAMEQGKEAGDQGKRRRGHPADHRVSHHLDHLRRTIRGMQANGRSESPRLQEMQRPLKALDSRRTVLPRVNLYDSAYRRLDYCRDAEDVLIGLIGNTAEARWVRARVRDLWRTALPLHLAAATSTIRHAKEGTSCRGYEGLTRSSDQLVRQRRGPTHTRCRTVAARMRRRSPEKPWRRCGHQNGDGHYESCRAVHRPAWGERSDAEVILADHADLRGRANDDRLAYRAQSWLATLYSLGSTSLFKTLAAQPRTTVAQIARRLRKGNDVVYADPIQGQQRQLKVCSRKDLRQPEPGEIDRPPNVSPFTLTRTAVVRRLKAETGEYGGTTKDYGEVHHVRKRKAVTGKALWQQMMAAMRPQTMVLCVACHHELHSGSLPDWR